MSHFAVTIETIGAITAHNNADRLEIANLAGKDYEFIVVKGEFTVSDPVVYFPIDSLLPEWIVETLNLTGRLSGAGKNRVKTVKLRGKISQGIVAPIQVLATRIPELASAQLGDDVTTLLGVEKYDPPPVVTKHGELLPLPQYVSKYDVESAQNYTAIVDLLMDEPVYITEKLEGSHWSIAWFKDGDEIVVTQRNFRIEPVEAGEHLWHKMAREGDYAAILRQMAQMLNAKVIVFRGEIVGAGIQNDYYKLKQHRLYLFEIEVDGKPVPPAEFIALTEKFRLQSVPVLGFDVTLRAWLDNQTLKAASDGRSKIADKAREGVVIKPMVEQRHAGIGRVMLKQRSPQYLAKSDF